MSDQWQAQLQQIHNADKIKRQAQTAKAQAAAQQQDDAAELLRRHRAHELLRLVQKNLLDGQGLLTVYETPRKFDRAIVLAWQGPVSDARRPDPKSDEDYQYILIGVMDGQVWVNHQPVVPANPTTLKAALLQAAKNPAVQKSKNKVTSKFA